MDYRSYLIWLYLWYNIVYITENTINLWLHFFNFLISVPLENKKNTCSHMGRKLVTSRCSPLLFRRLHRTTAIKIVRSYRTISGAAAPILVGFPPFELQILRNCDVYIGTRSLEGGDAMEVSATEIRLQAQRTLL